MQTKLVARLISYIFDPSVIFFAGTMLLAYTGTLEEQVGALVYLGLGGLLPISAAAFEYFNTPSHRRITREERTNVYISAFLGFSLMATLFNTSAFPNKFWMFMSITTAMFFGVMLLVNTFMDKASAHVGVYALWVMILIEHVSMAFGLLFAALPIIMWSRLTLKRHTWVQMFWGLTIGMGMGLMSWLF